jgi:hypothetical protein
MFIGKKDDIWIITDKDGLKNVAVDEYTFELQKKRKKTILEYSRAYHAPPFFPTE